MQMAPENILSEVEKISPQLISDFDAAWNARDAEALASLFHEDADFQFYNGLMLRGRRLIQRVYASSIFPSLPEGLRHKTEPERIRLLSETVALGDARVAILDANEDDAQKRVQRVISATIVLTKGDECWAISAVRLMVPAEL
jgi:uncharacterized protein (TIGR02246 family)